tara:strand:+ start:1993 stop:3231 length:1239 start_codon:yes stop_codon:yes gene_type:complete
MKNKSSSLWKKANLVIPTGNSFLSKNRSRHPSKLWPIYFDKSKGCAIWDYDGKKYYDFSFMGVGTNVLGYSNANIDSKLFKILKKGNMTTLNCPEEPKFAYEILKPHPWAKMAKFAKTGAEANAIAIRLARAHTKKNKIILCGYHGWHDWYLAAKFNPKSYMETHLFPKLKIQGVPNFLKGSVFSVKYNNFEEIKRISKKNKDIAAIIMEVKRFEEPEKNYLSQIRNFCTKNNICLIFDECTTGFRENYGGLHLKYKINPDLAMFGKAIGNGYSITTVIGKKKIMKRAKESFISSTFWSERIGFTAGLLTLNQMRKIKSWEVVKNKGKIIKANLIKLANKYRIKIRIEGNDSLFQFFLDDVLVKDYKKFIAEEMIKKNFLASNIIYVSVAHSNILIKKYLKNMDAIFKKLKK